MGSSAWRAAAPAHALTRAEELQSLQTIVAASVKEAWPAAAVPDDNGCCDPPADAELQRRRQQRAALRDDQMGNEPKLKDTARSPRRHPC
jgi:hypothetical protein